MAKQTPLARQSKSLFDALESVDASAPKTSDAGGDEIVAKRVSAWAPVSVVLALASPLAFVNLGFLVFAVLAILAGFAAFYVIIRSSGEVVGKGVAGFGICLAVACLVGAPFHEQVYEREFGKQADAFARVWFETAKNENIALNHQLRIPYWQRSALVDYDDAVGYWVREKSGDEEPHYSVHGFLCNPTLLTINKLGDRAHMSRYSVVENLITSSKEQTSRIYAITCDPETSGGEKETFFVNLIMERVKRKTPEGKKLVGWQIIMNDFNPLPIDEEGRPYIKNR